jgi:thioredoxin-related protein
MQKKIKFYFTEEKAMICSRTYLICSIVSILSLNTQATLIPITSSQQFETIIKDNHRVVAKFSIATCSVCNEVKQPFEELTQNSELLEKGIVFVGIEYNESLADLFDTYDINAVPTFLFIENEKVVSSEIGVKDSKTFSSTMASTIKSVFFPAHSYVGMVKAPDNSEKSFIRTMIASFKSAYNSMADVVSTAWQRLVS